MSRQSSTALAITFGALFILSGACGLTYEVVWSRLLVHVFGVTAFAVSTVLVSFMGGMALGAMLLGRRADRTANPLRMFAVLEAGIGLYALLLPALLSAADRVYAVVHPVLPSGIAAQSLIRFVLCVALLAVPTVLMGATLPALGRGLLRRQGEVGLGVGLLYFVNTLGAAIGCFLAGFVLIPQLGLRRTTLAAAAVNGAIALAAWWLGRPDDREPMVDTVATAAKDETTDGERRASTTPRSWPLWVAFGSGMAALAFEVVWFRILVLSFGSTVYSFSAMLATFLLGLAVGAPLFGAWADRSRHPVRLLAITQGLVAFFTLVGAMSVNRMPDLFLTLLHHLGRDFDGMNRTKLMLSALTLLPAAIAFGGTFPVAVRLYRRKRGGTGARIGAVYAWNTFGAIAGSFGAGFILLPWIGSEWVLYLVVAMAIALATGSILAEPGPMSPRWAIPAGLTLISLIVALVFAPPWDRGRLGAGAYFEPTQFLTEEGEVRLDRVLADYRVMTFTEGYNDTIISFQSPKGKFITVNGSATASDQFEDMFSQRMLGHLPMALHPGRPRNALIVGLGAGVTAGAIALYEIDELVAVELEQGVFEASRFFQDENHGVLDRSEVRIPIDDGRNYLKMTDESFDVISSAPNFPSLTGSGALYSVEYFELARSRLAPGGVMCQFAPIWRLNPSEVKTIVQSFLHVFPHVRVFSTGISLVMLGREDPFPSVQLVEIGRRIARPGVRNSLAEIGVRGPVEMLSFFQFDEDRAREYAGDATLNTDDRPVIEFRAPRALFTHTVGANLQEIVRVRGSIEDRWALLRGGEEYAESYAALARASDAVIDAGMLFARGADREAIDLLVPVADSGQRYARYQIADRSEKSARALQAQGELKAAQAAFRVALHYENDRLDSMIGLGFVDLYLGAHAEAEAILSRAVDRFPESGAAAQCLGLLRELQGDLPAAEDLYRRAVRLQPGLSRSHALLGHVRMVRGDPAEALVHFENAIDLGEDTVGVYVGRAHALLETGEPDAALRMARDAVDRFPLAPDAVGLLAMAAESAGRHDEAEEARRRLQALLPEDPPVTDVGN